MKITITGRQMNVYDEMKQLVEKKLQKLDKYFSNEPSATVTLKSKNHCKRMEITIVSDGVFFRSEVDSESFRDSLDEAISNIDRQIRKNKTKLAKRLHDNAFIQQEPIFDDIPLDEEEIVRTKTYSTKPISPEEAILQMNLLGHQFFVFINSENDKAAVVYKRKEGGYGLMLPNENS